MHHFRHLVGEYSFHWQLSQVRNRLFRDEEFADLYCLDNGRPSVPPSLLATALLLQAHDKVTTRLHCQGRDRDGYGKQVPRWAFVFEGAVCDGCPLRPQCVKAAPGHGRSVNLHAQEGLLQASPAFAPYRVLLQAAEHRLARLMQLGLRQARYRGHLKTQAQLLLTATVANLTRIWAQAPA